MCLLEDVSQHEYTVCFTDLLLCIHFAVGLSAVGVHPLAPI